jgi:hypothetical protein
MKWQHNYSSLRKLANSQCKLSHQLLKFLLKSRFMSFQSSSIAFHRPKKLRFKQLHKAYLILPNVVPPPSSRSKTPRKMKKKRSNTLSKPKRTVNSSTANTQKLATPSSKRKSHTPNTSHLESLRFQLRWILTNKTKLLMIRNSSPHKFKPKPANLNTNKDSLMMQDSAIFSFQDKEKWLLPIWKLSLLLMLSSLKGNAKIPLLKKYKDKLRDWAQKMIILEFTKTSLMSNLWLRTNLMVAPSMTSSPFLESTLTISLSSKILHSLRR